MYDSISNRKRDLAVYLLVNRDSIGCVDFEVHCVLLCRHTKTKASEYWCQTDELGRSM